MQLTDGGTVAGAGAPHRGRRKAATARMGAPCSRKRQRVAMAGEGRHATDPGTHGIII